MSSLQAFIQDRLQSSPLASEWVSLIAVSGSVNVMDVVRMVQSEGFACQTLSADHTKRLGVKEVLNIAEMFLKKGVVVILTCQSSEELDGLADHVTFWKTQRQVPVGEERGRFMVLAENTSSDDFTPRMQEMADYTVTLD